MKEETYKIELDKKTMEDLNELIMFSTQNFPFTKDSLWGLNRQLLDIRLKGCFKHNILQETFDIASDHKVTLCRKCNPKEYKKYSKKVRDTKLRSKKK